MKEIQFAKRVLDISPSTTLSINQKTIELKNEGVDIISFSVGEPKFKVPKHILDAAKKALDDGFVNYTPAGGIKELRIAVAEMYNKKYGSDYTWENTIITVGAKHGLFNLAFVLFLPGDEIIVPVPYWVSYPEMVKMAEAKNVFLPLSMEEGLILTASRLEKVITSKTKAVFVNTPNNPSGAVIPKEELDKIVKLAVERDLYILFDECYEKFVFGKEGHCSLASYDSDVRSRTILVNSASKTFGLTGLRIGYITAQKDIIKKMNMVQSHQTSNPCSVAQKTVLAALQGDQNFLNRLIEEYASRADALYKEFNSIDGVRAFKPDGAFYIFPDVSGLIKRGGFKNDLEFVEVLLEKANISAVPGSSFGMDGYLRFSFVESREKVNEGIRRFKEFANKI
jgi:aspartate aminotransferase